MVSALRTCASCFESALAVFSTCLFFCSAHLCKLLLFLAHAQIKHELLLLCALVQVASVTALSTAAIISLLLCALVQVASRTSCFTLCMDSPSALRTCASCFGAGQNCEKVKKLLLCALVQVASPPSGRGVTVRFSSALRTCASCFNIFNICQIRKISFCSAHLCKLLLLWALFFLYVRFASALRTCASCFFLACKACFVLSLLLCALVQVASLRPLRHKWPARTSALRTCASCFR